MRQESEQQTGRQAGHVGDVVDEREIQPDADVHDDPEDELPDESARPRLMPILRRTADGEDEGAEDAEDRAAGTNGGAVASQRAGNRRAEAAGEVDQGEAWRSE